MPHSADTQTPHVRVGLSIKPRKCQKERAFASFVVFNSRRALDLVWYSYGPKQGNTEFSEVSGIPICILGEEVVEMLGSDEPIFYAQEPRERNSSGKVFANDGRKMQR